MDENDSWIIVPMMLMGVVVVTMVGALLLEFLPKQWFFSPMVFGAGVVFAVSIVTAVIMAVAITQLGCC